MSTIRFEDLGAPIQRLLKSLKGGVTDEDMDLMAFVSVKDMAKIYNDMATDKKAEQIWAELRKELQRRKDEREGRTEERKAAQDEAEALRLKMEEAAEDEERLRAEEERLRAERKAKKKAEKERRRREQEELERQLEEERLAQEAEEETAALEEEERKRKKAERRQRKEQKEQELLERQEEEEALAKAEAEEEQRRIDEKLRKKEEKRRKREEQAALLAQQQEEYEQELVEEKKQFKKRDMKSMKEQWEEHVKNHPLEFAPAEEEVEIKQAKRIDQSTHKKPEAFMKITDIRIPEATSDGDKQVYILEVRVTGQAQVIKVQHRYSEFAELKKQLGVTAEICTVPFPGKSMFKLKGASLDKRRQELEAWMRDLLEKFGSQRNYAGVSLAGGGKDLRGDAARAEAERQRMQQAAGSKKSLEEFCGVP